MLIAIRRATEAQLIGPIREFAAQIYPVVRPYGRVKLAVVIATGMIQGLFQALGVSSIVPFLMLMMNPDQFLESAWGQRLVAIHPDLTAGALITLSGVFSIAMLLLANGVSLWADIARSRYVHGSGHCLRMSLVQRALRRSYMDHQRQNTSVLTKKIVGDVTQFSNKVLRPLFEVFACLSTTLCVLVVLLLVQPAAALVAMFGLGAYYCLVFRFLRNRRIRLSHRLKEARRGEFVALGQLLGGLKMVLVRNCADTFVQRISDFSTSQARAGMMAPIYGNMPRYLLEPLAYGSIVAWILVEVAAGRDISTILPTGGLIAMAGYRLLPNLQQIYAKLVLLTTWRHTLEEIVVELNATERPEGASNLQPVAVEPCAWMRSIELADVSFAYDDSREPVIKNVRMDIAKGSFVGLVGSSGAGKSTLADLLLGLISPTSGQLLLDGKPLSIANLPRWRTGIGYVPQDVFLLDATVEENIAFGVRRDEIDHLRVREVARLAQLHEFLEDGAALGLRSRVGERGAELSGGQQQRIGLARALYFRPRFVILDESTSALDNVTANRVISAVRSCASDVTIFAISHRLNTLIDCDLIYYLDNGTIRGQGEFGHLMATCPEFRYLALLGNTAKDAA